MFLSWLKIFFFLFLVFQPSMSIANVNGRTTVLMKKFTDNTKTTSIEGSGAANLDDYEDEDELLSKVTATSMISTTSSTTTTGKRTTLISTTTKRINANLTDEVDENEFKEDFSDDLEDNAYDQETSRMSTSSVTLITTATTRTTPTIPQPSAVRIFFNFLTRPPIAAGILVGLSVGILLSVILLICIVQRFRKRDTSRSSYTTGLLYPNRYGYSKSPQEFYA